MKEALEKLKKQHKAKQDELQVKNVTLSEEMKREKNDDATLVQKVTLLERQYEDATTSAASSSFSKFLKKSLKSLPSELTGNTLIWYVSYLQL